MNSKNTYYMQFISLFREFICIIRGCQYLVCLIDFMQLAVDNRIIIIINILFIRFMRVSRFIKKDFYVVFCFYNCFNRLI